MKKITILIVAVTLLVSCSNPEKKAQKLIEKELQTSLNDPKSYESVNFGSLDSVFTSPSRDIDYIGYKSKYDVYTNAYEEQMAKVKLYSGLSIYYDETKFALEMAQIYLDTVEVVSAKMIEISTNFVYEFDGWKMKHTFRGKNAFGAVIVSSMMFYFDKELTKVYYSDPIE